MRMHMFMMAKEITDEEFSSSAAVSVCRPQGRPSLSSEQEAVAKLRQGREGSGGASWRPNGPWPPQLRKKTPIFYRYWAELSSEISLKLIF
jgi:hypothetical protein